MKLPDFKIAGLVQVLMVIGVLGASELKTPNGQGNGPSGGSREGPR